jgi:hypothetical protein
MEAKHMGRKAFIFFVIILPVLALNVAAADRTVSYQGRVTDSAGSPINENSVNITVKFFDASTGGSQLSEFSESHLVSIVNGLFNLEIGSKTIGGIPSTIFDGVTDVYLSITIYSEEQIPRPKIVNVPYSLSTFSSEVNCEDYAGTVDTGTFCIDQDWSPVTTNYIYSAQQYCQNKGMRLCTWIEYSTACAQYEAGQIVLYNILHYNSYNHQHASDRSGTTMRAFGHKKTDQAGTCYDDQAAMSMYYYPTAPNIHFRCCIQKY